MHLHVIHYSDRTVWCPFLSKMCSSELAFVDGSIPISSPQPVLPPTDIILGFMSSIAFCFIDVYGLCTIFPPETVNTRMKEQTEETKVAKQVTFQSPKKPRKRMKGIMNQIKSQVSKLPDGFIDGTITTLITILNKKNKILTRDRTFVWINNVMLVYQFLSILFQKCTERCVCLCTCKESFLLLVIAALAA